MTTKSPTLLALEDAVRALRDLASLDPDRPTVSAVEKTAVRSLERIGKIMGTDVASEGHTPRPDEDMFPGNGRFTTSPSTRIDAQLRDRVRRATGAPLYTGPSGTEISDFPA